MRAVDFPVVICPADERDLGYIVAYWVETSRPKHVPISTWKRALREDILEHVKAGKALVAHTPADRDLLYGFAVASGGLLRYVFVRPSRRRGGLGESLARGTGAERYAPGPRSGEAWARRRGFKDRKSA